MRPAQEDAPGPPANHPGKAVDPTPASEAAIGKSQKMASVGEDAQQPGRGPWLLGV